MLDRVLLASAVACAGLVLWSGPRDLPLIRWLVVIPFLAWVLLPLLLLRQMLSPATRDERGRPPHWTLRALGWLMAVGTPALYGQTMLGRQSSTAALVFVFLPFYQLVLIGGVRLVAGWLTRLRDRST